MQCPSLFMTNAGAFTSLGYMKNMETLNESIEVISQLWHVCGTMYLFLYTDSRQ